MMDVKRFLRAMAAECAEQEKCRECPFSAICLDSHEELKDGEIDDMIAAAAALPDGRTYAARFFDAFPDAEREEDGTPVVCRNDIFGEGAGVCALVTAMQEGVDADGIREIAGEVCARCWKEGAAR